MKPLSGPSEAHRTKNGTFKQSYRLIVVAGQWSAADSQFIPQDPRRITQRELNLRPAEPAGDDSDSEEHFPSNKQFRNFLGHVINEYHWTSPTENGCFNSFTAGTDASHTDMDLMQRTKTQHQQHQTNHFPLVLHLCVLSGNETISQSTVK